MLLFSSCIHLLPKLEVRSVFGRRFLRADQLRFLYNADHVAVYGVTMADVKVYTHPG